MILAGFAGVVDIATDRQVSNQFVNEMNTATEQLQVNLRPIPTSDPLLLDCTAHIHLYDFARADRAQIRVFNRAGEVVCTQDSGLSVAATQRVVPVFTDPTRHGSYAQDGYRVDALRIRWPRDGSGWLIYARPLSSVDETLARVRFFLLLGVIAGTVLALLAGLANAQRAMRPVTQLTAAAGEIERTRDTTRHIPYPEANDEVHELASTLESMLAALGAARAESEAALSRQREFVADASHELRTPLTSVLANLELLADELAGEQRESARSALRSTQRMRALVTDLLLLARADARDARPDSPTDLADVLIDAAAEVSAVAEDHELRIDAHPAVIDGRSDDLHRMILNLLENAVRHTPAGTRIRARTGLIDGTPTLVVEDDGPGIPPELQRRVFDRFVRGSGESGRGTGLGLSIVRAVANSHGATVSLSSLERSGARNAGTRFVIAFNARSEEPRDHSTSVGQTSTTTGRTIGRRRSRS